MISTKIIRDNFSRAAVHYEKYADIQATLAEELLEEVVGGGYSARSVLDVGCGSGWLLGELKRFLPRSRLYGFDISFEMATRAKKKITNAVSADAVSLPFRNSAFDLVLSNAAYQWVSGLEEAFCEAQRVLTPRGDFIFNCFGAQTLKELRECFGIRESFLPRPEAVRGALEAAGFACVSFSVRDFSKHFDNLVDILSWLKYIGANRINAYQPFFTPKRLAEANHAYSCNYRNNGKVYASFEVIQVKARKAADS